MATRLFVSITNHHLVAYPWERDLFGAAVTFEQDQGVEPFRAYLETFRERLTVYMLIDLTEEEHKLERIPRLNPLVRKRMLENRSSRLLRNTPFRHVLFLGRDPEDSSQDWALFSGLNDPEELVLPWLELLKTLRLPLAGIWSVPLLTTRLFQGAMTPDQKDVLLLSIHAGGLRQTFLHNGQMSLSRLSRLPTQEMTDLVPFLHGEVARMQGYLVSQRLYSWNDPLHVHVLCHAGLFRLLQEGANKGSGGYHLYPLDGTRIAARVALKSDLADGRMDPLFGQCLLRWAIPNHYARPEDVIVWRTLRLGRRLRWAALFFFVACLLGCLLLFWQGRTLRDEQPELSRQAEEIQKAVRRLPDTRTQQEGRRIITAVKWAELLEAHLMDPGEAIQTVGQTLLKHERLILESLEWNEGTQNTRTQPAKPGGQPQPKAPSSQPQSPQPTRPDAQMVLISGRVEPFDTLKAAMADVERFIQDVRALPECMEVQPVQMPLNLGDHQVIQGGEAELSGSAPFRLRILLSRRKGP
ncbi:MAG: hypothetical protein HQL91_01135 [Magnetococcales bacterium]|nr:hypothetical protein [Magnetococcales bacterium]